MLIILENHDYPLVFNIDRKVPTIVTFTLFLLSVIGTIVIPTGCTEVYLEDANDYVVPHIVTIDPPIQEFTREEAEAHDIYAFELADGPIPLSFIHLPRGEPHTITITFSSPPEDVTMRVNRGTNFGTTEAWTVEGAIVEIDVVCALMNPPNSRFGVFTIEIEWRGGGKKLQLFCPLEYGK